MLEVEWWDVRWRWSLEVWVVNVDDHRVQVAGAPEESRSEGGRTEAGGETVVLCEVARGAEREEM